MKQQSIRAYLRETDGTLTIITVLRLDGAVCDRSGYPLTRTDERETLRGWPDEGPARVWRNSGGREILVPELVVSVGICDTKLFLGDGWSGIDTEASAVAFATAVADDVREAYPNATVEVEHGPLHRDYVRVDGGDSEDVAGHVETLLQELYTCGSWCVYESRETWIMDNDRYGHDAATFETVEEFEAMVRECFPGECDDLALRPGVRDGVDVILDEHDEVALRRVQVATVTVPEDVQAGGNVLPAGSYEVALPCDYDPAAVTGEDILLDDAIVIVD
jgi:hypothetical protein